MKPAAISLAVLPRPRSVLFSAVARARDAANKSPTGAGLTNFPSRENEPKEWQEKISTENHQSLEVLCRFIGYFGTFFVASGISSRCKGVNHNKESSNRLTGRVLVDARTQQIFGQQLATAVT